MSNIFNIKSNYFTLMQQIEEVEGEITEDVAELLKCNEEEAQETLEELVKMKKSLEADIKTIVDEETRLSRLCDRKSKAVEKIKESMQWILNNFGDDGKSGNKTMKTEFNTIFTKSTKICNVLDEMSFDNEDYVKIVIKDKFTFDEFEKIEIALDATPNCGKVLLKAELKEALLTAKKEELNSNLATKGEGVELCIDPYDILNDKHPALEGLPDYIITKDGLFDLVMVESDNAGNDKSIYLLRAFIETNTHVEVR